MKLIFALLVMALWAAGALAHSPLDTTTPAKNATVSAPLTEIEMQFKGNIRLTRVTVTHADHGSGDLDLDGFKGFASSFTLPIQGQGAGVYTVDWRGLGDDGHPMSGSFSFTVRAE